MTRLDANHLSLLETRLILAAYDTNTDYRMTIADDLKAARAEIAAARQEAANAASESRDAANLVKQEAAKARKEAADLRAEIAGLTNGGPLLDEPIGATILPTVTP